MSELPVFFRKGAERAILTFNFSDIAGGAFVSIDGFSTDTLDVTTAEPATIPSSSAVTSSTVYLQGSNVGGAGGLSLDEDFDTAPFTTSATLKGTALAEISYGAINSGGSSTTKAQILIKIVDKDDNETTIGTSAETPVTATAGNPQVSTITMKIDLTESTIKAGEKLRITVLGTTAGSGTQTAFVYCDPSNATPTTPASVTLPSNFHSYLRFHIPFRVDL